MPSPLVVSAPMRECRLWSTIPCGALNSSSSTRIGCPCQAIQRHMSLLLWWWGAAGQSAGEAQAEQREQRDGADRALEAVQLRVGVVVGDGVRLLGGQALVGRCRAHLVDRDDGDALLRDL